MSIKLRGYQEAIIDQARALMRQGQKRLLICSPTGSGKTALTTQMLGTAASRGLSSWFIVHRRELVKQSVNSFNKSEVGHGVISSGFDANLEALVQVASIQTLARRYEKLASPKLIVWDECHHIAAGSWAKIYNAYPESFHVGLTATPQRLDGKGLSDWFNHIVMGPRVDWLIKNEWLSPYRMFAPSTVSMDGVRTSMGDYNKRDLAAAMDNDKSKIVGSALKEYQAKAMGKRAVAFCFSRNYSKALVTEFNMAGIPAEHVDGETPSEQRDAAIARFERGETLLLSNVDLFGEGFDLPAIECAILLRPTKSLSLYLQQVGRALRPSPGKTEAIILDHVGNAQRHGLPDEPRDWSLNGMDKAQQKAAGQAVRTCQECFGVMAAQHRECPFCGAEMPVKEREILEVSGDLEQIDEEVLKRQRVAQQAGAQTFEDLVELGKKRGYKRPYGWAKYIFSARQKRKLYG